MCNCNNEMRENYKKNEEADNRDTQIKALEAELEVVKKDRDICKQINLDMLSVCMSALNADELEKARLIIKDGIHKTVINAKERV